MLLGNDIIMGTRLRKIDVLKPLFILRDYVMLHTGGFELKRRIKQKLFFKQLLREDAIKKKRIAKDIYDYPDGYLSTKSVDNDIVVSLTSYSHRVEDSLPYTLYSLLQQTVLPYKIVVYLSDEWSDESIPDIVKKLKRIGIDIRYCEDIRSFTKLIPALKDFPDNPIITVDDDIYYNNRCVELLLCAYNVSDKRTVLGHCGCLPKMYEGKYLPYSLWKELAEVDARNVSLLGVAGILYPPYVFDNEILNKDLFLRLCPTADDLWFWIQEIRCNVKCEVISGSIYAHNTSVNRIEQYDLSQRGTLMFENVTQGKNDEQLRNLLEYYNLH